jgi:hypothetical protein
MASQERQLHFSKHYEFWQLYRFFFISSLPKRSGILGDFFFLANSLMVI